MVNKILIPSILTATILVAGIFAFMPTEEAMSVHTTIQGTQTNLDVDELIDLTPTTADTWTMTCTDDWILVGMSISAAAEGAEGTDEDITITVGGERVGTFDDIDIDGNTPIGRAAGGVGMQNQGGAAADLLVLTLSGSFAGDENITFKTATLVSNNGTCSIANTT